MEGTGNSGSDFTIWGYNNTGNYLYSAFTIQRSNSYVGIGTAAPTSKLHVNGVQGAVIGKFTQSNIPTSDGYLNIQNGTSASGYFIPTIMGRAYVPGKPSGLYLIGEADDFVPVGSDTSYAAVMVDGRTKTGTRPANNNIFAVNTVGKNLLMVKADGSVGIGTSDTKGYRLAVNGSGIFTKVKVKSYSNWPDYVFDEKFTLPSLEEVNQYIRKNKHLPDMPAASEVEREGIDLGEINRRLVQKVEEQMLYIIQMNEDMQQLKERIKSLENRSK
ncbi:hypothetical protein CCY01nite_36890 [Chitinophaga cymbidii]|uniref:Peptidase S74 domain-containing protein n=1 Tax=Chitinophaga cymbidii TaxID=1096750 RepID=A0A512RP05_9BACT|nr:hypothetical protein CCY01nite_36890 [Chitinophaga cymbidii]